MLLYFPTDLHLLHFILSSSCLIYLCATSYLDAVQLFNLIINNTFLYLLVIIIFSFLYWLVSQAWIVVLMLYLMNYRFRVKLVKVDVEEPEKEDDEVSK